MKRIKKQIAIFMAAMMLAFLPGANALKAEAAEPVTYAVKYLPEEGGWHYQAGTSTFDEEGSYAQVAGLLSIIKDGDLVVVYNDSDGAGALDLGKVKLSNLTYVQGAKWSMVFAGGVKDCYVLGGSTGTINCDVENAYIYDTVVFNFNGNVTNMVIQTGDEFLSSIGCLGTVGHVSAVSPAKGTFIDYYDFDAGVLFFENGVFSPNMRQGGFRKSAGEEAVPASQQAVPSVDVSALSAAKAGENVNVSVASSFSIPVAVQNLVKEKQFTLACQLTGTGITLTLSGRDIKKPREDLVFQVSTQAEIPEDVRSKVTDGSLKSIVANIGEKKFFSQVLNLHVALGEDAAGKTATMYSFDEQTGRMRFEGDYAINEKGQAVFRLWRGDEYVIVVTDSRQNDGGRQETANAKNYVVARGDSLSGIASRNGVSLESLLNANPQIQNANRIYPGDVLVIPEK